MTKIKMKDVWASFDFSRPPDTTKIPMEGQPESTKKILARPPEKDIEHYSRPTKNVMAVPGAKTPEEIVGQRTFDPAQVALEEDVRRKRGARLAKTELAPSALTPEKKARAISAFTCSPPAPLTEEQKTSLRRLIEMTPYNPTPIQTVVPPKSKTWIWVTAVATLLAAIIGAYVYLREPPAPQVIYKDFKKL